MAGNGVNAAAFLTLYQLGAIRGECERRDAPTADDWAWLEAQADCFARTSERADAEDFAAGMAFGAGAQA